MSLLETYREKLADGSLKADPAQNEIIQHLAKLATQLKRGPPGQKEFFSRWFGKTLPSPRGIYIHGAVGRGKTLMMDLFHNSITTWPKKRIHFHAFMQEVHAARARLGGEHVIERIAGEIAETARLLCLDEMQIVDIADAMIIGRLYEALLARGVVLVTTSNLAPEELYKDGLNRQLFLPFIATLRNNLQVLALESSRDYRLGRVRARETYLHPATAANRVAFNTLWRDLTDGAMGQSETLVVLGRQRVVPKAAHSCASFTFFELCGEALGPPDYLAIAKSYRTVFVSGVPKLKAQQHNETKRFILMIDTFYDAATRLVVLSDVSPDDLFPKNQHAFESKRTVSRLKEMQSSSWWGVVASDT